ncbi:MAG: hypothetical protein Q8R79_00725 [Legionellaceae bacterium]|nr:hypothetical protein [Legionellaceae bacterium]
MPYPKKLVFEILSESGTQVCNLILTDSLVLKYILYQFLLSKVNKEPEFIHAISLAISIWRLNLNIATSFLSAVKNIDSHLGGELNALE